MKYGAMKFAKTIHALASDGLSTCFGVRWPKW